MRLVQKISNNFTTLNAQYLVNKNRNALRFQSQNISWNFEQVNYQAYALIKGLTSMKFQSNDNFLIKLSSSQQSESYIAKIATAGLGSKLFVSQANTPQELDQQIQSNNISCFFFEPNVLIQNNKLIDTINNLAPQLTNQTLGAPLKLNRYPNLRTLIQTNFYSFPGVYKFRAVMNYASDKYFNLSPINVQPLTIPSSNNPLIITDPANDFAFGAGVLNSLAGGRFVHIVQAAHAGRICSQIYNNNVDLIGTTETSVDPSVRVIVQKGSNLFSSHQNRVQM